VQRTDDVVYIGAARPIRPAPALGADTDEILSGLGVGDAERERLRELGVVR
jgi:crotonobetainyl-CoA:carnitine CoA-transferase CaiB-like acyl-CoA transferase